MRHTSNLRARIGVRSIDQTDFAKRKSEGPHANVGGIGALAAANYAGPPLPSCGGFHQNSRSAGPIDSAGFTTSSGAAAFLADIARARRMPIAAAD